MESAELVCWRSFRRVDVLYHRVSKRIPRHVAICKSHSPNSPTRFLSIRFSLVKLAVSALKKAQSSLVPARKKSSVSGASVPDWAIRAGEVPLLFGQSEDSREMERGRCSSARDVWPPLEAVRGGSASVVAFVAEVHELEAGVGCLLSSVKAGDGSPF
jgi:hypothetical protein